MHRQAKPGRGLGDVPGRASREPRPRDYDAAVMMDADRRAGYAGSKTLYGAGEGNPLIPQRGHLRFPLLDSLRGLAAISILVVHVAVFSDGFAIGGIGPLLAHMGIGVPFFFALSAFLLYRPFVAARELDRPRVGVGRYARRRFLRIFPAYWVALAFAGAVVGVGGVFDSNWWVFWGLLQNYPVYTAQGVCTEDVFRCGLAPTWTLAIEVAFYLALPFYALAVAWLVRRVRLVGWLAIEVIAALAIGGISIAIQSQVPTSDLDAWLFFSPLGRGWWFTIGLILAVVSVRVEQRGSRDGTVRSTPLIAWVAPLAGLVLYVAMCLFVLEPTPSLTYPINGVAEYVSEFVAFGLVAGLVLMPAIFLRPDGWRGARLLAHPAIAWLGLISYGIFLWQFPALLLILDNTGIVDLVPRWGFPVLLAATFALTVVFAAASFSLIERPLMAWRSGRRRETAAPARTRS
jgi:peptidoglycan/LPS O-acetylase OafA/YrhL